MTDGAGSAQIFIRELRLSARVGVNPAEQTGEQPITVDVWVGLADPALPARTERLRDTVDYVGVARAVRRVVAERHYPLVESLAAAVARAVLQRRGAAWVRVRLRKLECLEGASGAGVDLRLDREELDDVPPAPVPPADLAPEEQVVIVGGGAAGLAAALWCWRLGHPALVVDAGPLLGGQLHLVHGTMNDLPALGPLAGIDLARRLWDQFASAGGRWLRGRLVRLQTDERACRLVLRANGDELQLRARALIVATGVRRRGLDVPGERELAGRGVLATAARDVATLRGKLVVVAGGGDSAAENALLLARAGARVVLVHRGPSLTARAQFRVEVERSAEIELRCDSRVTRFIGGAHLEGVEVEGPAGPEVLAAEAALVRIGWLPNSGALPPEWLDAEGYVVADREGRVRGERCVFAAGDVLAPVAPSVAFSFGSGATAARSAVTLLEQPAVPG